MLRVPYQLLQETSEELKLVEKVPEMVPESLVEKVLEVEEPTGAEWVECRESH